MALHTFAAIDIGSYNISMEIFEISKNSGLRSLNRVWCRLELGADTFDHKIISSKRIKELIVILNDYKRIMAEYGVVDYRACAKSALREAKNCLLILESVRQSTGINIEVLSNSEQRFIGYEAIASKGSEFRQYIEKGTAIIDLGGGSVQVSLFDKDALVTTQNMQLGSLRMREKLSEIGSRVRHYDEVVEQFIMRDISHFKKMYLGTRKIQNVILVGDYFTNLIFQNRTDDSKIESRQEFMDWYQQIITKTPAELAEELQVDEQMSSVVIPSAILYRCLIDELGADTIWLPGIQLTDGIAYHYAKKQKLIRQDHDFEKDIILAAGHMSERYGGNKKHTDYVENLADKIYKSLKKTGHLDSRDRLLLRVAATLHDCGKYISMVDSARCAYQIIMSTEIIGLSDLEREMIAEIILYNDKTFDFATDKNADPSVYMRVARLAAILRVANALDKGHRQKFKDITVSRKEDKLIIAGKAMENGDLEAGYLEGRKVFFEEVFGLQIVFKAKS
ncbi:MAG: HD domain-containing protein [Lachnospiraceae bacterium]|nr:HD domain-containing protein [Candidatus Equihabitans merdae]